MVLIYSKILIINCILAKINFLRKIENIFRILGVSQVLWNIINLNLKKKLFRFFVSLFARPIHFVSSSILSK